MLVKEITYTNYNDVEVKRTLYFNLTKTELSKMELGVHGGFTSVLQRIIDAKSVPDIVENIDKIILMSYCEKSDDGERLVKSPELSKAFSETAAYDALFYELCTDSTKAAQFVNGIMPKDLMAKAVEANPELKAMVGNN